MFEHCINKFVYYFVMLSNFDQLSFILIVFGCLVRFLLFYIWSVPRNITMTPGVTYAVIVFDLASCDARLGLSFSVWFSK